MHLKLAPVAEDLDLNPEAEGNSVPEGVAAILMQRSRQQGAEAEGGKLAASERRGDTPRGGHKEPREE